MPMRKPVNQRGTVDARLVDRIADGAEDRDHVPAGLITFADGYDGTKDVSILYGCPCWCGALGAISIKPYGKPERPLWQWDGNREKPTLTPSILIHQLNDKAEKVGEHWHGFLTAGVFKSC